MVKKCIISTIGIVVVSILTILLHIYLNIKLQTFFYSSLILIIGLFFVIVIAVLRWRKLETGRKLSQDLFLSEFGLKPDESEVISTFTSKFDRSIYGISPNSVRMKFWLQGKVYKGVVDIENENLYIQESVLLRMHTGDVITVWKDVTALHSNGKPKKVEFRDASENLCGVDYLDEEGTLKKGSLRRYEDQEIYWFPEKQAWEP